MCPNCFRIYMKNIRLRNNGMRYKSRSLVSEYRGERVMLLFWHEYQLLTSLFAREN